MAGGLSVLANTGTIGSVANRHMRDLRMVIEIFLVI